MRRAGCCSAWTDSMQILLNSDRAETPQGRSGVRLPALQLGDQVTAAHGRPALDAGPPGELVQLGPGQVEAARRRLVVAPLAQVLVAVGSRRRRRAAGSPCGRRRSPAAPAPGRREGRRAPRSASAAGRPGRRRSADGSGLAQSSSASRSMSALIRRHGLGGRGGRRAGRCDDVRREGPVLGDTVGGEQSHQLVAPPLLARSLGDGASQQPQQALVVERGESGDAAGHVEGVPPDRLLIRGRRGKTAVSLGRSRAVSGTTYQTRTNQATTSPDSTKGSAPSRTTSRISSTAPLMASSSIARPPRAIRSAPRDQPRLQPAAEQDAVHRHRPDEQRGGDGGREQRADVQPVLELGDLLEPLGERQGQQEREQELHAGLGDAQLLQ